jgi:hypothetical protein
LKNVYKNVCVKPQINRGGGSAGNDAISVALPM